MHYYPFHIADFALHTTHLTLEEEAVYRRLLDYYYDKEIPIPRETKPVIRRLRLDSYADIVGSILEEFFVLEDDGWHNLRADIVIQEYNDKAEKARQNGKKGGRPKKNRGVKTESVNLANPEETGSKANQELKPITKTNNQNQSKSKSTPAASLDYSSWPSLPDQQILKDWLSHRKQIKAPVSQTVVNSFGKELNLAIGNHFTVDQCLEECMNRGWRGFKAEWLVGKVNPKRPGGSTGGSSAREALQEWANSRMQGGAIEGEFSHE